MWTIRVNSFSHLKKTNPAGNDTEHSNRLVRNNQVNNAENRFFMGNWSLSYWENSVQFIFYIVSNHKNGHLKEVFGSPYNSNQV